MANYAFMVYLPVFYTTIGFFANESNRHQSILNEMPCKYGDTCMSFPVLKAHIHLKHFIVSIIINIIDMHNYVLFFGLDILGPINALWMQKEKVPSHCTKMNAERGDERWWNKR